MNAKENTPVETETRPDPVFNFLSAAYGPDTARDIYEQYGIIRNVEGSPEDRAAA